jgi:hypothetical protein
MLKHLLILEQTRGYVYFVFAKVGTENLMSCPEKYLKSSGTPPRKILNVPRVILEDSKNYSNL